MRGWVRDDMEMAEGLWVWVGLAPFVFTMSFRTGRSWAV